MPGTDDAGETVEDDLGEGDEAEPHAEAEDAAGVGDELGLGRLHVLQEAFGVGILWQIDFAFEPVPFSWKVVCSGRYQQMYLLSCIICGYVNLQ